MALTLDEIKSLFPGKLGIAKKLYRLSKKVCFSFSSVIIILVDTPPRVCYGIISQGQEANSAQKKIAISHL